MAEVCGPAASRPDLPADGAAEPPASRPAAGRSQLLVAGWQQLVLEVITGTHRDARTLKKLTRNVVWLFGFPRALRGHAVVRSHRRSHFAVVLVRGSGL